MKNDKLKSVYVSRAGNKLESVAGKLKLDFRGKTILDVGSSTGGFTDFALRNGASTVVAVDSGSNQLHQLLRQDKRIDLREKTDIRDIKKLVRMPDIVLIDVSFISLRAVLPHIEKLISTETLILALMKPQFEADADLKHKGIIKNEAMRRSIFRDFETWTRKFYKIIDKSDSSVFGEKGNKERFYLLRKLAK